MKLMMTAFVFLVCTVSGFSQSEKDLVGKWKFKEIVENQASGVKPNNVVKDILQDLNIEFSEAKYSLFVMDQTEYGTWVLNGKKIDFTSQQGKKYSWDIKGYREGMLHLVITNAEIVLTKATGTVAKK